MRSRSHLFVLAVLTGMLLVLLHPLWLPAVGAFLIVQDPLVRADAIVPLAGGPHRVTHAVHLFRAGYAPYFVVADPDSEQFALGRLTSRHIMHEALEQGVPASHMYLTAVPVTSTYTEARAVRNLAEAEGWQSLIIVTSPEHTRRTRIIFRHVLRGSGIAVSVQPAINDDTPPGRWWQDRDQRHFVLQEYAKLFAFLVGYRSGAATGFLSGTLER